MLFNALINSPVFKQVKQDIPEKLNHAYLFYSSDRLLNENIASLFCYAVLCDTNTPCFKCDNCRRIEMGRHPDLIVVDKPTIQVKDVENIIDQCILKPVFCDKKIIFIKNAHTMNEAAQNKLLKTLEEPNRNVIFVFSSDQLDRLLVTVQSRLKKIYVSLQNFDILEADFEKIGVSINVNDLDLTSIVEYSKNETYLNIVEKIKFVLKNLHNSSNIPKLSNDIVVSVEEKKLFLAIMYDYFSRTLKAKSGYKDREDDFVKDIGSQYSIDALIKILPIIQKAYYSLYRNVNFGYVVDNMLYEILKVRYLCK